jgi:hypothetical protein
MLLQTPRVILQCTIAAWQTSRRGREEHSTASGRNLYDFFVSGERLVVTETEMEQVLAS